MKATKQQTAVEWLVEQLKKCIDAEDGAMDMNWLHDGSIEKAKEMEKEQIIDFANNFADDGIMSAEQYYTENYKK